MILVDTSIWVDHLSSADRTMERMLEVGSVVAHPFVIGEIAMGYLHRRGLILEGLAALPMATVASHDEVLTLVDRAALFGIGIGYVDAHLLASARLTDECQLWSRDKRLVRAAARIGISIFGI